MKTRTLLLGLILLLPVLPLRAAEEGFATARSEMLRGLRSKNVDERSRAVYALDGFDSPAAARTLVRSVLSRDDQAQVIHAAVQLLGALKGPESRKALILEAKNGSWRKRARVLWALGERPGEDSLPVLLAAAYDEDSRIRISAILALENADSARVDLALEDALLASEWPVRAAAIDVMRFRGSQNVLSVLVSRLRPGTEPGRLRGDLATALSAMTGQYLGVFPRAWDHWLKTKQGKEAPPLGGLRPVPPTVSLAGVGSWANRVVYVLGIHETMGKEIQGDAARSAPADVKRTGGAVLRAWAEAKTKLDVAQLWLAWSVGNLAPSTRFNIITYGSSVSTVFGDLMPATPENRQRGIKRVRSLSASGNANLHAGLMKIYQLVSRDPLDLKSMTEGPEVVYFLSDGGADYGVIRDGYRAFEEAEILNRYRQIRFHCFGVGEHDARVLADLAGLCSGGAMIALP